MAKKRASRGASPLEWIAVAANVVAGAAQTFRESVDLNLDDDEVAEIWKIDTTIRFADPTDPAADETTYGQLALVMDPSFPVGVGGNLPESEALFEDLECLYTHFEASVWQFITAAGVMVMKMDYTKQSDFGGKPILVATNPAMVYINDTDCGLYYWLRLYFTRKKATGDDLTRILLKRR